MTKNEIEAFTDVAEMIEQVGQKYDMTDDDICRKCRRGEALDQWSDDDLDRTARVLASVMEADRAGLKVAKDKGNFVVAAMLSSAIASSLALLYHVRAIVLDRRDDVLAADTIEQGGAE